MIYTDRLRKHEWIVKDIPLKLAQELVSKYHYAGGGSNTGVYTHGLFKTDSKECVGVAWWLPPPKPCGLATFPENWRGVLGLTRVVIVEGVPKNACTFLISRSRKMIDREKWPCLVTFADEWQGHLGGIYRADNWDYEGRTKPERLYTIAGRMVARKAGPRTRRHQEMIDLGAVMVGRFSKHKYVRRGK